MRMQLAGKTINFNIANNIYYDNADRGFRAHDYLGLYNNKSARAIGKICARITAVEIDSDFKFNAEFGDLTEERRKKILEAILDGDERGYNLRTIKHRYFFVEKFYETDFIKNSPRAPWGTRIFNLSELLETSDLPKVEEIADSLKKLYWN